MRKVEAYMSKDGKLFTNAIDCEAHEKKSSALIEAAMSISKYCSEMPDTCEGCIFCDRGTCIFTIEDQPIDWNIPSI